MSIASSFEFAHRPFATQLAPGGPAGMWVAFGEQEGNATGGTRSMTHLFQALPNISNSNLYSIEYVQGHDTAVANDSFVIQVAGMDQAIVAEVSAAHNTRFQRVQMMNYGSNGPIIAGQDLAFGNPVRPWFLGQPSRNPSLAAILTVTTVNVDGDAIRVWLQGYFWSPSAMNAPGGLVRPTGSIYGN